MLISRNSKILAATVLALGLAACTTKRTGGDADGAGTPAGASAGSGAIGADASAATVGGGIDSQSMGGADGTGAAASAGATGGAPLSVRVVHFDYDSADLQQDAFPVLQAHAQHLRNSPSARLAIGGHTDERGTREYNMALGERRAKTVAAFLASNGAKEEQLEVISFGEEKPLSLEDSESAWSENRRAELSYTAGQPKP
ncbi:MAG: peptidoglycan-associated lipoprotein Pal [Pseudomonadota bacterium]